MSTWRSWVAAVRDRTDAEDSIDDARIERVIEHRCTGNPVELLVAGAAFALLHSFARRVLSEPCSSNRQAFDPDAIRAAGEVCAIYTLP